MRRITDFLGKTAIRHTQAPTGFAPLFQLAFGLAIEIPSLSLARPLARHLSSVVHPFIDRMHVKTVVAADFETRDFTFANQSVDRARMKLQVLGDLDGRHYVRVICGSVVGLHLSSLKRSRLSRNHFQVLASAYLSKWTHWPQNTITGSSPSNSRNSFSWARLADIAAASASGSATRLHSKGLYHADWSMSLAPVAAVEYLEASSMFASDHRPGLGVRIARFAEPAGRLHRSYEELSSLCAWRIAALDRATVSRIARSCAAPAS
jgi:hypothetical protein